MDSQARMLLYSLLRQGRTFRKILKSLNESEYYSAEQLEALQNRKLVALIEHCYKNVPYYTELFDRLKLKPEDIRTKADLVKLPYMDKQIAKKNYNRLIAQNK